MDHQYIYTLQYGRKSCGNSSYLWSYRRVPTIWEHQDTESESWEMKIGVAGPILTHRKTSKALWEIGIHTLQDESKISW